MRGIFGGLGALGHLLGEEAAVARKAGGCSFAAGTPVQMANGVTKSVESIHAGDQVLTKNEDTGNLEVQTVTATISHPAPALVTLTLSDVKTGQTETLTCSPEHPYYVDGQGFTPAGALSVGNSIVTRAGPSLTVTKIDWLRDPKGYIVYNFTVDQDHSYFVGVVNGGAWVHNMCILTNKLNGDAFRDEIATLLRNNGHNVEIERTISTPWGARRLDIALLDEAGNVLSGIETKVGGPPYNWMQRMKDMWIKDKLGIVVNVVRK